MQQGEKQFIFSTSKKWMLFLGLVLFGVITWTGLGHHRYYLTGDAGFNFSMHIPLRGPYFKANMDAWSQRRAGLPEKQIRHMRIVEGGFPLLLVAARKVHDRLPFMINALLLPFMLLFFFVCVFMTNTQLRMRWAAAGWGLVILLSFTGPSTQFWELALPYRDTLSHTLGFAALAVLYATAQRPTRSSTWIVGAGLLIGLSGWTRLSGFLFAAPAALLLLVSPAYGAFKRRLSLIAWLGAGLSVGLGLLLAQNVFEGRRFLMLPQAETLLWGDRLLRKDGTVRVGWHPVNLPFLLPFMFRFIRDSYPAWLHVLFLAGLLGWVISAGKNARLLAPLASGFVVFALFYGCYHKVVPRYAFIAVLFYTAIGAVALAWLAERALTLLCRVRLLQPRMVAHVYPGVLILLIAFGVLRSEPNAIQARDEWADAQRFGEWMSREVPADAVMMTSVQGLGNWVRFFDLSQKRWSTGIGKDDDLDPSRIELPDGLALLLVPFHGHEDRYARGWIHDALLNRYDVEPFGEPVYFSSLEFDGARLFRVGERSSVARTVEAQERDSPSQYLFLYLRDLTFGEELQDAVLRHESWPREWPVRLQAGANFLVVPAGFSTRPQRIHIHGIDPLPSVVEAAWVGDSPVDIPLNEAAHIASRLLLLEGAALSWSGFPMWWRDWGAHSERFSSSPHVCVGETTGVRLPFVFGATDQRILLRLFYSSLGRARTIVEQAHYLRYRKDEELLAPVTILVNQYYRSATYAWISDYVQEIEVDASSADGNGGAWLVMEFPESSTDERPVLFLHHIQYRVADADETTAHAQTPGKPFPVVVSWNWNNNPRHRWMILDDIPMGWDKQKAKAYIRQAADRISSRDASPPDDVYKAIRLLYGSTVCSAHFMGDDAWDLPDDMVAIVFDSDWSARIPLFRPTDTCRILAELHWLGGEMDIGTVTGSLFVNESSTEYVLSFDEEIVQLSFLLPVTNGKEAMPVRWEMDDTAAAAEASSFGLHAVRIRPLALDKPLVIDVGDLHDGPFIGEGLYKRERHHDRWPFRWTSYRTTLHLYMPAAADEVVVRLAYNDDRPQGAPSARMQVYFDGQRVPGEDVVPSDGQSLFKTWEGVVGNRPPMQGIHELEIRSQAWSPETVMASRDTRMLGVMLHRVEIIPKSLHNADRTHESGD